MTRLRALAAGLFAGLAIAARLPTVFVALAPLGVFLSHGRWRGYVGHVLIGLAVFPILTAGYNLVAFGSPFSTGYKNEPEAGFTAPMMTGLAGLLFSPTCGLLIYSPWAALALIGGWRCVKRRVLGTQVNALGRWLVLGFIGQWLLFSKWWAWNGALTFGGPRMLAETLPALAVLIAAGGVLSTNVCAKYCRAARILFVAFGVISVLHFLVGTAAFDAIAPMNPEKPDFEWSADILARYHASFGTAALVGASLKNLVVLTATFALVGYMAWRLVRLPVKQRKRGLEGRAPRRMPTGPEVHILRNE